MLTMKRPIVMMIDHTAYLDAFPVPGEPIAVQHLCEEGMDALLGSNDSRMTLAPLVPTRVRLQCTVLDLDKLISK